MFIEISYLIGEKETVLIESLSKPKLIARTRMNEGGKNNTSILELSTHNGTHVDTPLHVIPDGPGITDLDIADFIFEKPLLINCPKDDLGRITAQDLQKHEEQISKCDFLMVYTGFSAYRVTDPDRFIHKSPGFSSDGGEFIARKSNIRGIMVDCLGIENIPEGRASGFATHKIILGSGRKIIAVEDGNLSVISGKQVKRVFVVPLRVVGAEASPVTVIAEL
jgi:arylformamidase